MFIKKIASALASTLMIGSTIGLAAAANYPQPFVTNGAADVALVYGSHPAASADYAGVVRIQQNLQSKVTSTSTSAGTNTIEGGDYVVLEKGSTKVNVGDAVSTVFGTTVNDDDLEVLLADGTYRNGENIEFDYEQKITLGSWSFDQFSDSEYNDREPSLGVRIADGTHVLNYTLEFTTDAESDVSGGDLVDFETTTLTLLGKEYYISDFDNSTLDITLLDTANSGVVNEGETTEVMVGDTKYEVSAQIFSSTQVVFTVNGERTNSLNQGQTQKLADGTYLGIKNIYYVSKETGISQVEFSLGSGKLELLNGESIEVNDVVVDEVMSYVTRGTSSSGKEKIDKIILSWTADEDVFVTEDSNAIMPGFESLKLSMLEVVMPAEEVIEIGYDGDDSIEISVPIKDGVANFNLLYANSSGEFIGLGKDSTQRLVTSNTSTLTFNLTNGNDEWFVASYASTSEAESYLLKVSSVSTPTSGSNKTTITNVVTGSPVCSDKSEGDTCTIGEVTLTITTIFEEGSNEWVVLTRGSDSVSFHDLYTAEGLHMYLPFSVANSTANTDRGAVTFNNDPTLSTAGRNSDQIWLFFDEENKDETINGGTEFNITLNDNSDGDLHVTAVDTGKSNLEYPDTDNSVSWVSSELGTMVERIVSSDKGQATITYHGDETYARVVLTASDATVGGSPGSVPILLDTEISQAAGKNVIVVGGSCVNTYAATLLGSSTPLCGADWTAVTGVNAGEYLIQSFSRTGDKVATLVAGYNIADTDTAATALTTQTVDTAPTMKYKGTTATNLEPVIAAA